jgi:branched-chain amino acid transport system permease protein
MGVDVFRYKVIAFVISCFFAGVAGSLWAFYSRYVDQSQFSLWQSVWFLAMIIVGGMGSVRGAILGTVFLRGIEEVVTSLGSVLTGILPQIQFHVIFATLNMVLGLVVILFLIYEPRGLAHRWELFKSTYRLWPFPY